MSEDQIKYKWDVEYMGARIVKWTKQVLRYMEAVVFLVKARGGHFPFFNKLRAAEYMVHLPKNHVGIGLEEDRTDTSFASVSSRDQSFFSSLLLGKIYKKFRYKLGDIESGMSIISNIGNQNRAIKF